MGGVVSGIARAQVKFILKLTFNPRYGHVILVNINVKGSGARFRSGARLFIGPF